MTVSHGTAIRGVIAQAVLDALDAGSKYVVLDGSATVLGEFTLDTPAGTRSGAVVTISGLPKTDAANATGTAASFEFRDSGGTKVWGGTLATSGGDMTIDNTSITAGQTLSLNATTSYTAAP